MCLLLPRSAERQEVSVWTRGPRKSPLAGSAPCSSGLLTTCALCLCSPQHCSGVQISVGTPPAAGRGLLRPRWVSCMIDWLALQASWRAGHPSLFQLRLESVLGNGACSCLPNRTLAPHCGDASPSPPVRPPSPEQVLLPRCLSFLSADI